MPSPYQIPGKGGLPIVPVDRDIIIRRTPNALPHHVRLIRTDKRAGLGSSGQVEKEAGIKPEKFHSFVDIYVSPTLTNIGGIR